MTAHSLEPKQLPGGENAQGKKMPPIYLCAYCHRRIEQYRHRGRLLWRHAR